MNTSPLPLAQTSGRLVSYEDIVFSLNQLDLSISQIRHLSQQIGDIYASKSSQIISEFPCEVWFIIFNNAGLPKIPLKTLLPLRTVCQTWDKTIRSFPKINAIWYPRADRLLQIFALRSLCIDAICHVPPVHLLTGLHSLHIIDPTSTFKTQGKYSRDLNELSLLTNLTKLTLTSEYVTSINPLTSLQRLTLQEPYNVQQIDVLKLPHLTRIISDSKSFFVAEAPGIFKDTNSGRFYEGGFKNGLFHGRGKRVSDGITYEGDFWEGLYHGQGKLIDADQSMYEGAFQYGTFHGQGKLTYANGNRYEGTFEKSSFNVGTLFFANGDRYQGEWNADDQPHGQGTLHFANGDVYVGQFIKGRKGKGTTTNAGEQSSGDWFDKIKQLIS